MKSKLKKKQKLGINENSFSWVLFDLETIILELKTISIQLSKNANDPDKVRSLSKNINNLL